MKSKEKRKYIEIENGRVSEIPSVAENRGLIQEPARLSFSAARSRFEYVSGL